MFAICSIGCSFDTSGVERASHSSAESTSTGDAHASSGEPTAGSGTVATTSVATGSSGSSEASGASSSGCTPLTWYPDGDRDGFGDPSARVVGCEPPPGHVDNADDCNDRDPQVNPAADELCDASDNDCDGGVDEGSASNLTCSDCVFRENPDGGWYAWCTEPRAWQSARDRCVGFAGDLAVITSALEHDGIVEFGGYGWIGIEDRRIEGQWFWVDGTQAIDQGVVVGYDGWLPDQPNDSPPGEDCAIMNFAGPWNDLDCSYLEVYLCEHPA